MDVHCRIVAVFFFFFSITVKVSEAAECGVIVPSVQRIVGGESVTEYRYPWLATILNKNDYSEMSVVCGGSLITDRHVVTAAHCFPSMSEAAGSRYRVVFELVNRCDSSSRGVSVGIAKVNINPKYAQSTMVGDIAIITLAKSVDYSPICLPQSGSNHSGGGGGSSIWSQLWNQFNRGRKGNQVLGDATVIGFGSTKVRASRYPCYLQEATVKIISKKDCKRTNLPAAFTEVPNTICAGILAGRIDSCDGDSGGPLQTVSLKGRYTIQGITSFGEGCGRRGLVGIYTQVSAYVDWINQITKQNNNNNDSGGSSSGGSSSSSSNRPSWPTTFNPRPPGQSSIQLPMQGSLQGILNYFFPSKRSNLSEKPSPSPETSY